MTALNPPSAAQLAFKADLLQKFVNAIRGMDPQASSREKAEQLMPHITALGESISKWNTPKDHIEVALVTTWNQFTVTLKQNYDDRIWKILMCLVEAFGYDNGLIMESPSPSPNIEMSSLSRNSSKSNLSRNNSSYDLSCHLYNDTSEEETPRSKNLTSTRVK